MTQVAQALRLLLILAASTEGLTHTEMAERMEVSRRTAERMRDALGRAFQMEERREGQTVRYLVRTCLDPALCAPTAEELADLLLAATEARHRGNHGTAGRLDALHDRILAATTNRTRLAPDIEALANRRLPIVPPGPRVAPAPGVEEACTLALLAGTALEFDYDAASGQAHHVADPLGLLVGPRSYLVAAINDWGDPTLFRLDRIRKAEVTTDPAKERPGFDLTALAARSFGIFQEPPHDIVLRFDADVVAEAAATRFHPAQTVETLWDDRLEVRFRAGGLLELARHLFAWGGTVEIVDPTYLRDVMREELEKSLERLGGCE